MCESVDVRYVHYMQHPNYPETLAVGCVCAEHMEDDYVRPKQREAGLRLVARRRKSWAGKKWRISQLGNHFINIEGFNLFPFCTKLRYRKAIFACPVYPIQGTGLTLQVGQSVLAPM